MANDSSLRIEEIAAAWLAKRDGDDWTDSDRADFARWLQMSTAHRVAFVRLESAWREAHRLKALGAGATRGFVPLPGEWRQSPFFERTSVTVTGEAVTARRHDDAAPAPPSSVDVKFATALSESGSATTRRNTPRAMTWRRRWSMPRAFVASVALAVALGTGWYIWPHGLIYRTDVGGLEDVPLSDGSTVTLNTATEIRVAVTESERRVTLDEGEAYFQVAKDPTRPFVVSVGDKRVIAVGTKFAVRRDGDTVRVVVTEGRVRLERTGPGEQISTAQFSAGTIAHVVSTDTLVQEKPIGEAEDFVSWRRGLLVFRDTSLGDAIAEFNRYNERKIVIDDPAVAALHVGGSFRSNNVEAFVRLIERGFPVHAEARGDQILLKAT